MVNPHTHTISVAQPPQALSRRGLHTTAVEVARLLYALNPVHDPCGALLYLDYLALRAKCYTLLEFLAGARPEEAPSPSLAFSLALGRFLEAGQGGSGGVDGGKGGVDGGVQGKAHPDELLMRAVLMYPGLVVRLMANLRVCGVCMCYVCMCSSTSHREEWL